MIKRLSLVAAACLAIATPVSASHVGHTDTPFASRGACESLSAKLVNDDQEFLLAIGPHLFDSVGDVSSFLTRAFTCELADDGQWYLTDHRVEVLDSDWFGRK